MVASSGVNLLGQPHPSTCGEIQGGASAFDEISLWEFWAISRNKSKTLTGYAKWRGFCQEQASLPRVVRGS